MARHPAEMALTIPRKRKNQLMRMENLRFQLIQMKMMDGVSRNKFEHFYSNAPHQILLLFDCPVVYFDQFIGAAQPVPWSEYVFLSFLLVNDSKKKENMGKYV